MDVALTPVLADHAFPAGTLSISIGLAWQSFDRGAVSQLSPLTDEQAGEALFRAADEALYAAKGDGRNRVWETKAVATV